MSTQDEFERLVEYIHSAIESEQPEPSEFKPETELRLRLVYAALRRALEMSENVGNGNHSAVQIE